MFTNDNNIESDNYVESDTWSYEEINNNKNGSTW